ncbi:MAG: alanine--tRNA ligase [Firmicutes bacterium]|nr:alanine--tRNA ligase [[Eubacterium] siraeum]MCM1487347.1 alanine--tRNA ligase [Bacillota bacterium]
MKWTSLNDLRESYLKFFESKGHLRMDSAPLVPQGDNSVLLINAGMTPLKKYFQGLETPPCKRVTTCQKCIRTPDIENVGKTSRHGTYFEMLGNFSFGDYFKHEAISWAWEYLTKILEIPEDKLWVTIYEEDDEAGEIWAEEIGVPRSRIVKLGKKDNFWEHGSGPCGPCSEIHFDRGEKYGPLIDFEQAEECDRIIEIWNNVFTQFDNDGKGNYTQLKNKNIDTGMGLDRLACVMQGVDNMFEVDTAKNIIDTICELTGKKYKANEKDDVAIRVILDHTRASTFLIGDGVRPSNEGRGYVLRRLIRRAARYGRLLGMNESFLYKVAASVIKENEGAYPEVKEKEEYIKKVLKAEEDSFNKTVEKGTQILTDLIDKMEVGSILSGEDVFKLHDTYGFPLDLTKEILAERNLSLDETRFRELMENQRATARSNQAFKGGWDEASNDALKSFTTKFIGYTDLTSDTQLKAILKDGQPVDSCAEGEDVIVLIETTPFYAESGGQVGDKGTISNGDNILRVVDTKKILGGQFICECHVECGSFYVNDSVHAEVDRELRMATARNHTCAHLLQAALRKVLGDHVHQSGSYVDPYKCRFDFSHFSAMTVEEIAEVEKTVNEEILKAKPVITEELPIEEAQKRGAMALFGEKYGKIVRVVSVPEFSTEFCGGTHLTNTSQAGLFKITSETSVANGVRRIEAVTGLEVINNYNKLNLFLGKIGQAIKASGDSAILNRCISLQNEVHDLKKEIDQLNEKISATQLKGLYDNLEEVNGIKIITAMLTGTSPDSLRKSVDKIKNNNDSFIAVLAGVSDNKGNFVCCCSPEAISKGANAGQIVRRVAEITGAKGGGKPDMAMSGIGDLGKIDDALLSVKKIVEEILKN